MLDGHRTDEDSGFELSLRPRGFDEYVGQDRVKENLAGKPEAVVRRALDLALKYSTICQSFKSAVDSVHPTIVVR